MAATESEMLKLGTIAPEFSLPDPDGVMHSLGNSGRAYLVMFICNHCPFVIHVRKELTKIGHDYVPHGVTIVAINSNDVISHPGDSPEKMKEEAIVHDYAFPYVFDEDQSVAKAYRAACTPDFFLFDAQKKLAYRGQLDGSRPSNREPVTGSDIRVALDAVLNKQKVPDNQRPSIGCNIKWKSGNEPHYFR